VGERAGVSPVVADTAHVGRKVENDLSTLEGSARGGRVPEVELARSDRQRLGPRLVEHAYHHLAQETAATGYGDCITCPELGRRRAIGHETERVADCPARESSIMP